MKLLSRLIKLINNPAIIGYVEKMEPEVISGWAINRKGANINLECRVDGVKEAVKVNWLDRADVATRHHHKNLLCGFEITFSDETKLKIKNALSHNKKIEVFANKTPLKRVSKKATKYVTLKPEKLDIRSRQPNFDAAIESWGHFTLCGTIRTTDATAITCGLLCGGKHFDCNITWDENLDATPSDSKKLSFEIELPGYLWETITKESPCCFNIQLNSIAINLSPLELTCSKAVSWINDIVDMEENQEKQYRALLALEHVHYGRFMSQLPPKSSLYLRNFSEMMNLPHFALSDEMPIPPASHLSTPKTTHLIWDALRALNARITKNQPLFEACKSVIDEFKLNDKIQEQFLRSVVPQLCNTEEYLRLSEIIDLRSFERLSQSANYWQMTLAIPALIARGNILEATETVKQAAKNPTKGWLNTECIRYSVKLAQQKEQAGEIDSNGIVNFSHAVIALIDSFNGEWFSRLHDLNMVDSMILLLMNSGRYPSDQQITITNAAIRNYGLNPSFWQRLSLKTLTNKNEELAIGHNYFVKIHTALCQWQSFISKDDPIAELIEPLNYFQQRGNLEAIIYLREIYANRLPEFNEKLSPAPKTLLADLLSQNPAEAMRLAAFPLKTENALLPHFPETSPGKLRETISSLSDPASCKTLSLQEKASSVLKRLLDASGEPDERLEHNLVDLINACAEMEHFSNGYLAFDLLASAYCLALKYNHKSDGLLGAIKSTLDQYLQEATNNQTLPAPLSAGLSRLNQMDKNENPQLGQFLESCNRLINKDPNNLSLPAGSRQILKQERILIGWPHDTIVIIYSCRKYLDSRVKTIQQTWAQNLTARKIPYFVLVGDGNDSLEGNLLALDVPDTYENLPKKTLKLIDWIYHHTHFQYVLKIDDDCYLDVPRFFDTLSYRKHHYYGRVIRRGVGSMDRTWHQSKSHNPSSRKSVDKSPEPSVYADGGGAYSLSRFAMHELLKASHTFKGKRLISHSFMEDKLVGDLLALKAITPSNEDHESYQRRRTFDKAMPVAMWENTFFPCQASPTKVVHLDCPEDLEPTQKLSHSTELWPKKIWPTCWSPGIKLNNNQLELLSSPSKVAELMGQNLIVIAVVRNETTMLPHFLAHYRNLGVRCFAFIDNCSDDGSREFLIGQPDVILFSSDTEYKYSHFGVAWQQAVLGNLCIGKWVLLADADELLIFKDCETRQLTQFIDDIASEGCDAACICMVDMYPQGKLDDADFKLKKPFEAAPMFDNPPVTPWHLGSGWFSNSASTISHLRHRVAPYAVPHDFVSQKYALFRYAPWVRVSQGLHYASNLKMSNHPAWFAHFKYHAGFKEKIDIEIRRKQHFNNAEEYRRYFSMLVESEGGFSEKNVSCRYVNSDSYEQKL